MDRRGDLSSWIGVILVSLGVAFAGGCAVGPRPTLAESSSTGYPDIDDLLERLGQLSAAQYSADYAVLLRFGDITTEVSASQSDGDRRSLTIGDVRYVVHGSITKTCTVSTGACVGEIDAARVSDVQMTPDFFGTSLIARIRLDASRASGEPTASTEVVQGVPAVCVAVPVGGGSTTYCVFENGVLARLDAPDLVATMTGYSTEADETLYSEGATTSTTTATTTTSATSAESSTTTAATAATTAAATTTTTAPVTPSAPVTPPKTVAPVTTIG